MKLAERILMLESVSPVGIGSSIKTRMRDIEDRLKLRNKMSREAKAENEWKEKTKEYEDEYKVLNSMLSAYKKYWDI